MVNSSTINQPSNKQPIRLGIWGLPGSGKTVYMTMLYHYLSQGGTPWRIVTDDKYTEDFVNDNLKLMIQEGDFCKPTMESGLRQVYSYKLINDEIGKIVELTFFDLPGEIYKNPLIETINVEGDTLRLIEHLNQCHGILFLLSPLEENSPNNEGGSYFTFLGNLFRSMQRLRDDQKESKLEPYIVFCITKIDHPEVYKKALGRKAEDWLLKLLGPTVKLTFIANFFHAKINTDSKNSKNQTFSPDPSELNRCRVMPISCFGVDNLGHSPVYEEKKEISEKIEQESVSQSSDPMFSGNKSNTPISYDVTVSSKDAFNQDESKKLYKIDVQKDFYPMNILSPIEWILKGIEKYYPKVPPLKSKE
jgi:GTPase SAR1 family protein